MNTDRTNTPVGIGGPVSLHDLTGVEEIKRQRLHARISKGVKDTLDDYFDEHGIRELMEKTLTQLIKHRPANPHTFLAQMLSGTEVKQLTEEKEEMKERVLKMEAQLQRVKKTAMEDQLLNQCKLFYQMSLPAILNQRLTVRETEKLRGIDRFISRTFGFTGFCMVLSFTKTEFYERENKTVLFSIMRFLLMDLISESEVMSINSIHHDKMIFLIEKTQQPITFARKVWRLVNAHNIQANDEETLPVGIGLSYGHYLTENCWNVYGSTMRMAIELAQGSHGERRSDYPILASPTAAEHLLEDDLLQVVQGRGELELFETTVPYTIFKRGLGGSRTPTTDGSSSGRVDVSEFYDSVKLDGELGKMVVNTTRMERELAKFCSKQTVVVVCFELAGNAERVYTESPDAAEEIHRAMVLTNVTKFLRKVAHSQSAVLEATDDFTFFFSVVAAKLALKMVTSILVQTAQYNTQTKSADQRVQVGIGMATGEVLRYCGDIYGQKVVFCETVARMVALNSCISFKNPSENVGGNYTDSLPISISESRYTNSLWTGANKYGKKSSQEVEFFSQIVYAPNDNE